MAERLIGPERCAGGVARDVDGNFIERFGCEIHLFTPGPCGWQDAMLRERDERRAKQRIT